MTPAHVIEGDCRDVLATLDADSIDAVVTDPPYELGFMGRRWDSTGVAFRPETWAALLRVMKPGAHLLAFGGTRTSHRMVCAIEDAGFEIRDTVCWLYGSGFPKSLDVSKAIDRAAGAEREVIGFDADKAAQQTASCGAVPYGGGGNTGQITAPATPEAARWQGWGTALKPAFEPIVLARKPLSERTVAANVLTHGTGALNIDAARVDANPTEAAGRWPANVCHDGSPEVEAAFAAFGSSTSSPVGSMGGGSNKHSIYGDFAGVRNGNGHGDTGTASRFFYSAKADKADRADSRHPTVKPVDLIRWLVRLITPPGGTVLDPFAGSGTTAEAAMLENRACILIERDPQHAADIRHRLRRWSGLDAPLFADAAN